MRYGLVHFLDRKPDVQVIGEAAGCADGCAMIEALRPELVVFDTSLAAVDGADVLRRFRERFPALRALVYTDGAAPETVAAAMEANIQGFVLKSSPAEHLSAAVTAIAQGKSYLDPAIADIVLNQGGERSKPAGTLPLTSRQAAILGMIGGGMANKEIARRLEISERTVKFHVSHILDRLKVTNRLQAVRVAWEHASTAGPGAPSNGVSVNKRVDLKVVPNHNPMSDPLMHAGVRSRAS